MIGVNQTLAWLQRAFLEMVLAHDVEAFEVWRDAIVLLCGCVKAVRDHATVFVEFCSTLRWQLIEAGGEVLWQDAGKNVILASVAQFVDDVRSDPEVDQRLVRAAELLTEVVPVGDMDEEDMPMFVDLNAGESY